MAEPTWKGYLADQTVANSASTYTELAQIRVREGASFFWLQIDNAAHQKLDGFKISGQVASDADWVAMAQAASDFTVSTASDNLLATPIKYCIGGPVTLPLSTSALMQLEVKGLYALKVEAYAYSDAAESDTTVSIYWSMR